MTIESRIDIEGAKVLVVDDIAANRSVLSRTLESAGYSVIVAPSGAVALKVVGVNRPDLILLDLMMPEMDGFEVCQRLKGQGDTADIPIIFITANNDTESVVRGFREGAVDFISKPFKEEEVLARVSTHLQIHGLSQRLSQKNDELQALNQDLNQLNSQLKSEIAARQQAEHNLSMVVEGRQDPFHVSGTLRHDAPSYIERQADRDILEALLGGEFCYVLTSRQMGKSSLMVRTANRLRQHGCEVATLDLTALGQNLTLEQWYLGLLGRLGRRLNLEDDVEDYWMDHEGLSPVRRFFAAIRDVVLIQCSSRIVVFVDELDVVKSLPFSTDEFFGALRECFNERVEDPEMNRLTFCLLGVGTPSDLIKDSSMTLFNIGRRVFLIDFSRAEANGLLRSFAASSIELNDPDGLLDRIYHWTHGHPYLTQKLCRAVVEQIRRASHLCHSAELVDEICGELFLVPRSLDRDDNLLFVRERLIRSNGNLRKLFELYGKILGGEAVEDSEENDLVAHLHLSGIVRSEKGVLKVRNRIYEQIFDQQWVVRRLDEQVEVSEGNGAN